VGETMDDPKTVRRQQFVSSSFVLSLSHLTGPFKTALADAAAALFNSTSFLFPNTFKRRSNCCWCEHADEIVCRH